jgi:2-haloacid dehalogenase
VDAPISSIKQTVVSRPAKAEPAVACYLAGKVKHNHRPESDSWVVFCVWSREGHNMTKITTVIFDVGRVLFEWDLRHLFVKLIDDDTELDWFLTNVVTPEWHFQHDAGRPLAEIIPERIAQFPAYADLIHAYGERFNETIPGPVPGSLEIVRELAARNVPLFAITNFGAEFWTAFRPTQLIFDHFRDIIVSGTEKLVKPDRAIYDLAIRRFGVDPAACLFVDDGAANIEGARAAGINGYVFDGADGLRTRLILLGLLK